MARQRRFKDRLMTNAEAKRQFDDRAASIDEQLEQAFKKVDWNRRRKAEKSIDAWVQMYCLGLLIDDAPPPKGIEVLKQMCKATTSHENYLICMSRGSGKSSYVECVTLHALATGLHKYVVIISNNARAAASLLQDIFRPIVEPDTFFAQDYPEVCLPFQLCKGSFRRRQLYNGNTTDIQKNSTGLVLAKLKGKDGVELPTSGSVVTVRGITSGLRGMKHGTLRPTLVLLDDLQDSETAENPASVEKLMTLIRKDVMNLGGKERLSVLNTATPIVPDDLVEKLKNDISWKTTIFKAIESFPDDFKNKDGLWAQYFKLWDAEQLTGADHTESLSFYKQHQAQMDKGASVFNPYRFSTKDGHISAIQKLLETRHVIGESAFQSEYQMTPMHHSYTIDISPAKVVAKITQYNMLEVPDGYLFVAGAIDLNTSYAATALLMAFKPDTTSQVIWHDTFDMNIDQKLPEVAYNASVHEKLLSICNQIKSLNIKIDGLAIDAGGKNWSAVCNFTKAASKQLSIPMCAFAGRASNMFNPFVKSRLRDAVGKTVLCGDAQEHVKAGAGQRYVFFDADFYKTSAQKALLCPSGATGSCGLYYGNAEEHRDFAIQVCNEKLLFMQHRAGRDIYHWKSQEPHDYLDCISMCYAVAANQSINGDAKSSYSANTDAKFKVAVHKKPKFRIV